MRRVRSSLELRIQALNEEIAALSNLAAHGQNWQEKIVRLQEARTELMREGNQLENVYYGR
jgi:hypothetical protein